MSSIADLIDHMLHEHRIVVFFVLLIAYGLRIRMRLFDKRRREK